MKLMTRKILLSLLSVSLGVVMSDDPFTPRGKGADVVARVADMIERSGIFPDDNKFLCRVAWVESKYGAAPGTYRLGYYGGIWQVDRIGWLDTVQRPSLRKYHQRIQALFDIDWTKTSWTDLQKPFYSGLAARLLLATVPAPIPPSYDLEAQGQYWKKYYNRSGAGTADKFVNDVRHARQGCALSRRKMWGSNAGQKNLGLGFCLELCFILASARTNECLTGTTEQLDAN